MRSTWMRRVALMAVTVIVLGLFVKAATAAGGVTVPQVLLAAAGCLFGYIVIRLTQAMFAAEPSGRRRARRGLMFAAAVPVLVLTPTAIGSSPWEYAPMILLGSAIWLALAMSYTSFILARATRRAAGTSETLATRATAKPSGDGLARERFRAHANHLPSHR